MTTTPQNIQPGDKLHLSYPIGSVDAGTEEQHVTVTDTRSNPSCFDVMADPGSPDASDGAGWSVYPGDCVVTRR